MKPKIKGESKDHNFKSLSACSTLSMKNLIPKEVKRRFGFNDVFQALIFVAVTCAGNMETIMTRNSRMTWLEEWFMYMEYVYEHSLKRWTDFESLMGHDLGKNYLREMLDIKLKLVLLCRNHWPMHASIDEDIKFRKKIWNVHFPPEKRQRIVLHDNTNVSLCELSDAAQHKSTISECYKECCAKGGDACQPCSWDRGLHLVTGACPDSLYVKLVLSEQCLQHVLLQAEHINDPSTNGINS